MNLDAINLVFAALGNKELWLRIGIGATGVSLIITGLILIVVGDKQLQQIVGTAGKAVATKNPVGAAVGVATAGS